MIPFSEQVKAFFKEAFPSLDSHQIEQLGKYVDIVASFNRVVNLVSRKDVANLWDHHILPSLVVLKMVNFTTNASVVDIGSGAGFPGIPLKIVRPDLQMVLVDSIRKKSLFLRKVIEEIKLSGVEVFNERLFPGENPDFLFQKFHIVLARAVTDIESLYSLAQPLLMEGGFLLAWKGEGDIPELNEFLRRAQVSHKILVVPPKLQGYSDKFEMLRIFKLQKRG